MDVAASLVTALLPADAGVLAAAPFLHAGELAAALSALLWASAGIVFARIHPPVSAAAINLGKNVSATICFVVLTWCVSGLPLPMDMPRDALFWFVLSGFVGLSVCDTFLLKSLLLIGPQRMSLIFTLAPVVVALVAIGPPFHELPSWLTWVGIATCLFGIVLAILERGDERVERTDARRGIGFALVAAVCQAAAVLMARYALGLGTDDAPVPAQDAATIRMLAGTLGLCVIGLPMLRVVTWGREMTQRHVGWRLFVAAFFGTFLGIWTNQLSLEWATHTGVASVLNSLMPVYLIPLSALFLGTRLTWHGCVATLIAVGGIALMILG